MTTTETSTTHDEKPVGRKKVARAKTARKEKPSQRPTDPAALRALDKLAKEANAALDRAATAEGRGLDLRATAAYKLAEAKKLCAENRVNFRSWCEAHVTQGYTEAVRLAKVGASEDPRQALEDMRSQKAKHNRDLRARKKAGAKPKQIASSPRATAETAIAQMPVKARDQFLEEEAARAGKVVLSKADAPPAGANVLERAQAAFEALDPKGRVEFLRWVAGTMDVEITYAGQVLS